LWGIESSDSDATPSAGSRISTSRRRFGPRREGAASPIPKRQERQDARFSRTLVEPERNAKGLAPGVPRRAVSRRNVGLVTQACITARPPDFSQFGPATG